MAHAIVGSAVALLGVMRLTLFRSIAVVLGFACAVGCSSTNSSNTADASNDGAATSTDCKGTMPECVEECGSDVDLLATCSGGTWSCEKSVDTATCPCKLGYAGIACKACDGSFAGGAQCNAATNTYECPILECADSSTDGGSDAPTD